MLWIVSEVASLCRMSSAYTHFPLSHFFNAQHCQYSKAKLKYYTWFCHSQLFKMNETSYQIRMAAFYNGVALKWLHFCFIITVLEKVLWLRLSQTVHQHNFSCICFKQSQALPWSAGWYDSLVAHHPFSCTCEQNPRSAKTYIKGEKYFYAAKPLTPYRVVGDTLNIQ